MDETAKTCIVVPCYNEARRLRDDAIATFATTHPNVQLVFVDDGSSDETRTRLEALAARVPAISLIALEQNQGKAEAVRHGILACLQREPAYVGYWDADLATPLDEIPRFVAILDEHPETQLLLGSRVMLLGRAISRRASRHYLGRVAATAISLTLGLPVYDTQCGAKLFRASPNCRALFKAPFVTGWIFDVEILARMIRAHRDRRGPDPRSVVREVPLRAWRDVAGSKVGALDFFRAMRELWRIRRRYLGPS